MSTKNITDLATLAQQQFDTLDGLDGSEELLGEHDHHVFEFEVRDGGSVHVEIKDGDVSVSEELDETSISHLPDAPTTIMADEEVIRDILAGDDTIVDAVWGGRAEAPVYGAAMFYTSWISRTLKAIRNETVGR